MVLGRVIDVLIGVPEGRRARIRFHPRYKLLVAALERDLAAVPDETAAVKLCRMKPSTFRRRFFKDAGVSFSSVRSALQVAISANALSAGERVKRAAMLANYSSPEVLARAFRRKMGCSPSEYRERQKRTEESRPGG